MRIIFAGTPELALPSLRALLNTEYEIVAVYTKPDQPSGRGQKIMMSPVKQLALAHNLPLQQPSSLRDAQAQETLSALHADLMVVIAYGLILPQAVLDMPRLGCINIHVSLLPRWRGASPIQQAILAGDTESGITIMQMEAGLDTGPILHQLPCAILPTDTSQHLHDRLAELGSTALMQALTQIEDGTCNAQAQDDALACYAKKIEKQEAEINWNNPAEMIDRQVRAYNPWPIAFTQLEGQALRIWQATVLENSSALPPGTIIHTDKKGIEVATATTSILLQKIQLAGGRCLAVSEVLNSRAGMFAAGKRFGT